VPPDAALVRQLTNLQARLAVLEARRVPYTREELGLFKVPAIAPPPAAGEETGRPATPAGLATLVAAAERDVRAGQFSAAENRFEQALRADERNVTVLAGLAGAQIEGRRYDAAQQTLDRALAQAPDDPFSLFLLGRLRYEQDRLDDALVALSRSAQGDPRNPETFNFLGITLGNLGLREAAETALRRAVQLAPAHASAHHNLAVIYATQRPAAPELARWHYQKALAAGHARNENLEQRLGAGAAPGAATP
jgi:tetratricopeptide (TPR) repeat protein